jgi:hypothetical protein
MCAALAAASGCAVEVCNHCRWRRWSRATTEGCGRVVVAGAAGGVGGAVCCTGGVAGGHRGLVARGAGVCEGGYAVDKTWLRVLAVDENDCAERVAGAE